MKAYQEKLDQVGSFEATVKTIRSMKGNNDPVSDEDETTTVPDIDTCHMVKALLANTEIEALVDSGAECSVISSTTLEKIKKMNPEYKIKEVGSQFSVTVADTRKVKSTCVVLPVEYNGKKAFVKFAVMEKLQEEAIFGVNIIRSFGIQLPFMTEEQVNAIKDPYRNREIDEILREELSKQKVEVHVRHDELYVRIVPNIKANQDTIDKHSTIGEIKIEFYDEKSRRSGSYVKQMHMEVEVQREYTKMITEWLKEKIIEEQIDLKKRQGDKCGLFNTNCFRIWSNKWRFVHNFVPVNKLIKDDTNDVPGIDTVFQMVGNSGATIFSKIDLKSAYLQIPLREKDRPITAFKCGSKRYRFITAPLGLKNIPSAFQRMIAALLQENDCSDYACNFLDDIIIFSKSPEEHVTHVQKVLDALTSVNLTIQEQKCHFFATKVPLLGY